MKMIAFLLSLGLVKLNNCQLETRIVICGPFLVCEVLDLEEFLIP